MAQEAADQVPATPEKMSYWKGKVAIITGANSPRGVAITKELLKTGLIVVGLDEEIHKLQELSLKTEFTDNLHPVICDLCSEDEIVRTFQWVDKIFGGINILINNAAVFGYTSLLNGSPDEWRHQLNVNVIATCLCAREAIASMRTFKNSNGLIINVCSTDDKDVPQSSSINFNIVSNYTIQIITEGLKRELTTLNSNIRVIDISPHSNLVNIPSTSDEFSTGHQMTYLDPDEVVAALSRILIAFCLEDQSSLLNL